MQSQEELYSVLEANKKAVENKDPDAYRTVIISISPQTRASLAAKYDLTPLQVHRRLVTFFKHHLSAHHVVECCVSRNLSLLEAAREFVDCFKRYIANGGDKVEEMLQQQDAETEPKRKARRNRDTPGARASEGSGDTATQLLPMLASSCPGWICYAEKTHGELLPHISTARSPQQMMGVLVKDYFASKTKTL